MADGDHHVSVGTPFPVLETEEDMERARRKKDKEQYVLDKQGRRRFHGAFTGGFSAGYYNTVGTKEGWTPSSFVSSRSSKSESLAQKPEEFMDDEDLETHGIAPRRITTRDPFTRGDAGKRPHSKPSVIPGEPVLYDLVVPARSTVGSLLLKAMGWREGQGVGPLVESSARVYGCSGPSGGDIQFAPHDVLPWQHILKDDYHGIGYRAMEETSVLKEAGYSTALYGMKGQAFGVGALEEEDDDIYEQQSLTTYHGTDADDSELKATYGWTGELDTDSWSLERFHKAHQHSSYKKVYPPPELPATFTPVHKVSSSRSSCHGNKALDSNDRKMVTEGPTRQSVFELVSDRDRERLLTARSLKRDEATPICRESKQAGKQEVLEREERKQEVFVREERREEVVERRREQRREVGRAITAGEHRPFASDPLKQERYELYCRGHRSFSGTEYGRLTEWEKQKELKEFYRTQRVYRPLETSLTDKFTRGHGQDDEPTENLKDSEEAAKMEMFGVMTRDVLKWHPHRALCKRFNIPDPYPHSENVGVVEEHRQKRAMQFEAADYTYSETTQNIAEEQRQDSVEEKQMSTVETEMEEGKEKMEEEKEKEDEADERPPMTLFKSIFALSSSESEDDVVIETDNRKKWQNLSTVKSTPLFKVDSTDNRQTNIDITKTEGISSDTTVEQEDTFGPQLPSSSQHHTSAEEEVLDMTQYLKKHESKSKHKHHHKDHRHRDHRHRDHHHRDHHHRNHKTRHKH